MDKYFNQIWGITLILSSMMGGLLFFLWFPDFISWLSTKLFLMAIGTASYNALTILPLLIFVGGITYFVFLVMLAIAHLRLKPNKCSQEIA